MRNALAILTVALLAACAASAPLRIVDARAACARGDRHVEITDSGRVIRYLGIRDSRSGAHEGFLVRFHNGTVSRVEDNVAITGRIPIHANDGVTLRGQYECDDGVIHWTHHDPSLRHPAGYIDIAGLRYQ